MFAKLAEASNSCTIISIISNVQVVSFIKKIRYSYINPIQDGHFRGCSRMGAAKRPPSLKSVNFYNDETWQLYFTLRRSKKYKNHLTHPLTSANISIFSPELTKFCYIKKYRYRLYFST